MASPRGATSVLIFDGDCGFCTTAARRLEGLLATGLDDPLITPWQFTDLAAYGVTAERATREVLWVDRDGGVFGGAAAFARWLRAAPGLRRWLGVVLDAPLIRRAAAVGYRLIARNRHRLPGGTPACALPRTDHPHAG